MPDIRKTRFLQKCASRCTVGYTGEGARTKISPKKRGGGSTVRMMSGQIPRPKLGFSDSLKFVSVSGKYAIIHQFWQNTDTSDIVSVRQNRRKHEFLTQYQNACQIFSSKPAVSDNVRYLSVSDKIAEKPSFWHNINMHVRFFCQNWSFLTTSDIVSVRQNRWNTAFLTQYQHACQIF